MTKGLSSFGKRHTKMHTLCCCHGSKAYPLQEGYPGKYKRKCNWSAEPKRPSSTGTGQMRHLEAVRCRFRQGSHEGKHLNPRGITIVAS
uniref:Large ribosomal subunit protein eL37 n=1 Tax=Prolemur simus TaxID=1328070 RepID=A0A8C8ZXT6_PROSS